MLEVSELPIVARGKDLSSPGVSWGAAIAGAFVASALSLILIALGAGLQLSAISPWSNVGAAASTVGAVALVWLVVTQIISSAMGGYLAGRLRTRWQSIHNDEVHFRDTANGLVAWAVGVVITVAFLATAATSMTGGPVIAGEASKSVTPSSYSQDTNAYFIDRLFRSDHPSPGDRDLSVQAEAGRIFAHSPRDMSASDSNYLAALIVTKTGLSPNDAAQRLSQTIADASQYEDTLRKAAARILLWMFIALLAGAFCASYAATIGGRQRDHVRFV
jgi:hypothetical protein